MLTSDLILASGHGAFDPTQTVDVIKGLLIAIVGIALIYISLAALFGGARAGNSGKVARVLAATVLALVPLFIAIGIGATQFGTSIFTWLLPGL